MHTHYTCPYKGMYSVCACTDYHYFSKGMQCVCHEGIACASYQYEGVCACPYKLIMNMKVKPQFPGFNVHDKGRAYSVSCM